MDAYFLRNLVLFARLLRFAGLNVSPEQVSELARVLATIGIARRDDVHDAARAVFVRRRDDYAVFDRAFELFFNIRGLPPQSVIDPVKAPSHRILRPKNIQQLAEQDVSHRKHRIGELDPESPESENIHTYSPIETLRRKDFAEFTAEEIRAAQRIVAQMDWTMGERRTRRKRPAQHGTALDFTRLVRSNLGHGAELFELPERENKNKPRPLVILADISGSMERYTRMLLELFHTLSHTRADIETFVFATHLTRVTPDLRKKSVEVALTRVSQHVTDWSGGTRIGEAFKTFNFKWARRVLRSGAVVLILSDGWDRGDLELLRDEMARLQRSCYRLIWLSPQLVTPTAQESIAVGLQVALPFVDDWMPVRNLDNLETLAVELSRIGNARPLRHQQPRASIPTAKEESTQAFMDLPQMGKSDYVRRTMTLRADGDIHNFRCDENPPD